MLPISTRAYCAYDAVVGRHCRVSRRPLHFPLVIATWTSAPFLARQPVWVIHAISVLGVETRRLLVPS